MTTRYTAPPPVVREAVAVEAGDDAACRAHVRTAAASCAGVRAR
jgi:hypothetical protein